MFFCLNKNAAGGCKTHNNNNRWDRHWLVPIFAIAFLVICVIVFLFVSVDILCCMILFMYLVVKSFGAMFVFKCVYM